MRIVLLLAALALGGCGLRKCQLTEGGACATDSDCALALCTDAACNCGCGASVARSRLGKDHPCLNEIGQASPSSCQPLGPRCGCAVDCTFSRPACVAGACTTRHDLPDGGQ